MKTAIIHDQLLEFGGAERVLVSLKKIFKDADVYTSYYNPRTLGVQAHKFKNWKINTFWANKALFLQKLHSPLRFLNPIFWEAFDLTDYELVISSSGSFMSKGVLTRPGCVHICYLHHPPRYLYYYETAIEWQKYLPIKIYGHLINHHLRMWDYLSSQRVDYFIANSKETKKRIKKFYGREAKVIYPPVKIPNSKEAGKRRLKTGSYYLTTSRLMRSKHIDVLIKAANIEGFKLRVIGRGRAEAELKEEAGSTVEFLGELKDEAFSKIYANATAFLFAAKDEEFGIAPIEALGWGLPVIALKSGGVKETIQNGKNGFLFDELKADKVIEKIKKLESLSRKERINMREEARKRAERFSEKNFHRRIKQFIDLKVERKNKI